MLKELLAIADAAYLAGDRETTVRAIKLIYDAHDLLRVSSEFNTGSKVSGRTESSTSSLSQCDQSECS